MQPASLARWLLLNKKGSFSLSVLIAKVLAALFTFNSSSKSSGERASERAAVLCVGERELLLAKCVYYASVSVRYAALVPPSARRSLSQCSNRRHADKKTYSFYRDTGE